MNRMNKANKYTRGSRWHSRGQRFVLASLHRKYVGGLEGDPDCDSEKHGLVLSKKVCIAISL